jgi:hypothetical protein
MTHKLLTLLLLFLCACLLTGGYLIYDNNRPAEPPTQQELKASLEKAIPWLLSGRQSMISQNDPILFWMLQESGRLTSDARLLSLALDYADTLHVSSPWQHYFNRNSPAPIAPKNMADLPDYDLLFLYGLTCDGELGALEIVRQQQEEDFCWETHPSSPTCLTHQLMGLRFMQRRGCGDQQHTATLIHEIQKKIETQLFWDFRKVVASMQRVLMLVESGQADRVKPIWLRNVLDAQQPDGGWSDFAPLIPLGERLAIGFTAKGIGVKRPKSNLHATTQGIFLLSLLNADEITDR